MSTGLFEFLPQARAENRESIAFPQTRFQGSKRKLAGAILGQLEDLSYSTVLDAFGGTGAVSYAFKRAGKSVTYNDILFFNHQIGLALIENDGVRLTEEEDQFLQARGTGFTFDNFIERTFEGIYYTRDENRWLDTVCQNIPRLTCPIKRAIAWFAVFQAALIKRPYNLFHRSNLYMRLAKVKRTFGNKVTWEGPFADYFSRFATDANLAVIDSGGLCRASCADATDVEGDFDLVYIDTPYIKRNGVGVDYRGFYHFLEGLLQYPQWENLIDNRLKHLPLRASPPQPWSDPNQIRAAFERLFHRYRSSILCVSYRSDGIPSISDLASLLRQFKNEVRIIELGSYRYALSPRREIQEMLLIGS